MESRVKALGEPLHQVLIVFPLGLLLTAVVFDCVHYANPIPRWADLSFWMIAVGLAGAVLAAVPGVIDWAAIPSGTRAKAVGTWQGLSNVVVLGLFGASLYLRSDNPSAPPDVALLLAFAGVTLGTVTAWLGGERADRFGLGVDPGAYLNAPSSLSDRRHIAA